MARTRDDWNAAYETYAASKGLSTSAVAEWKLLRDCVVTIAIIFEGILELFKADVDQRLREERSKNLDWYAVVAKEFQNGDSLTWNNGILEYAVTDDTKRIITQAASSETDDNIVYVKVAKDDGSGNSIQLTGTELTDFDAYMQRRKGPGIDLQCISLPADVVKYTLIALYDTGYDKTQLTVSLQQVFDNFKASFPFNDAYLDKTELIKELKIDGIKFPQLVLDLTLDNGTITVSDLDEYIEMPAGYFVYDGASTITLNPAP